jgi:hypothetical protein
MTILRLIVPFVLLVIYVFSLVDVILADSQRVRGLSKTAWLLIVIFLPVVGAILWFTIGRGRNSDNGGRPRTLAPDDDPSFLRNIRRDEEQDERIRRLEQELADLDDDPPKE